MKDYWKSYHVLEEWFDYDIPEEIDKKFSEYVVHHISEFAVQLTSLRSSSWSINISFRKDKHYYRLKLKFKGESICSYYSDDKKVIKEGKLCKHVPKQIDRFMNMVVQKCWSKICEMIENREDIYRQITEWIGQYSAFKTIRC